MSRERIPLTWETVGAVFEALEKAGFRAGDAVHVGRAISLLRPMAEIYAGLKDSIDGYDPPYPAPIVPERRGPDVPMSAGGWASGPMP